jgi:N-acetylglucosamine kinase
MQPAMNKNRFVVGVDGGGSKTVALLADENGRIHGRGESGSSNYHNIGTDAAGRAIKKAVKEAQTQAGRSGKFLSTSVVALAAIDCDHDKKVTQHFVQKTKIARKNFVVHDSVAALYASTRGKPGVIVNSGTGSVAAGINRHGQYARAGGWGYILDDEGSAYDIGRKGLNYAFRSLDGRTPATSLVTIFKRFFGVKNLEDVLERIYTDGLTVEEIAHLAPLVSKAAHSDQVSRQIVNAAGVELAKLVCAVSRQLKMTNERFTVTIVGGSFKSGRNLLRPFEASIRKECPHVRISKLKIEPVNGAVLLALSVLHNGENVIRKLR